MADEWISLKVLIDYTEYTCIVITGLPILNVNVIAMAQHQQIVHQNIGYCLGCSVRVAGSDFVEIVQQFGFVLENRQHLLVQLMTADRESKRKSTMSYKKNSCDILSQVKVIDQFLAGLLG